MQAKKDADAVLETSIDVSFMCVCASASAAPALAGPAVESGSDPGETRNVPDAESHSHSTNGEIDLEVVREMLTHFTFQDHQEAQELILSALQEINEHFGWVSLEAAELVAQHLGTTVNRVYGLLTFYADFRTQPRGKHFMLLCHGMSCYVMGSQKLIQHLQSEYGIEDGDTTADGELTVQVVNGCLGVCDHAPLVKLDDGFYGNLTVETFNSAIQRVISARVPAAVS